MPIYEYRCDACGAFDQMRSVAARDLPADCPRCGMAASRIRNGLPILLRYADDQAVTDEGTYLASHRAECLCCR
ncbi:zinc ribbon domain-containing protein [Paraburkholderia sp. BL10I2N1]|uniref:FmdB family zinc ribbon protein n=1 Tax=Paraburkholderia sp. BL10I2N1 TaxID=1938796 RepID=UPI00105C92D9|nr:zinc ribbon domain-containing protein [Paraburkholderia sp. BL10I2N1]TDN70203.1 putative FmdB family regulatory protein [Paraburkholderia sp. BL10I2N1]